MYKECPPIIISLNDVKVGGATVFPNINTRIPVIQVKAMCFLFSYLPCSRFTATATIISDSGLLSIFGKRFTHK